jgi:hypothetical protein
VLAHPAEGCCFEFELSLRIHLVRSLLFQVGEWVQGNFIPAGDMLKKS